MATSTYLLTFEDRPGYLFAHVAGLNDSLDISIAFWQEILAEAHLRKAKRLLVVENFRNNVTMPEMIQVCRYIAEQSRRLRMLDLCIAFVDEQPDQLADNRVGQEMALALGMCVGMFGRVDDAEAWLRAN